MRDKPRGYDIIGDIHGHADELKKLLADLDYQVVDGVYRQPERQVIFMGDFIDKGPKQREVLEIVIPMVEQGAALAVMGNHEFNALAFHTIDPESPKVWLRPRNDKNIKQHSAFLNEFVIKANPDDTLTLDDALAFFKTLPLWLELDGIRAVHACWDDSSINAIKGKLNPDNTLDEVFLIKASRKHTVEYTAVEALLKGVEHELPGTLAIKDKYDNPRKHVRVKWWRSAPGPVKELALSIGNGGLGPDVEDYVIPQSVLMGYPESAKPLFLGHYWMADAPTRLGPNIACLDYSVANGGMLVAYRWDGERVLDNSKFVGERYF